MQRIYKYQLPIQETAHIDMPKGAEIIRIDGLDGFIWVWAKVDIDAPVERREFKLFKTGGDISDLPEGQAYKYLGCGAIWIQMELMLYVFEITKEAS